MAVLPGLHVGATIVALNHKGAKRPSDALGQAWRSFKTNGTITALPVAEGDNLLRRHSSAVRIERSYARVQSVVSFTGEPDQALSEVFAAVEAGDRSRRLIDTVEHVLKVAQLARAQPARQVVERDVLVFGVVGDNEAFHAGALDEQVPLDARALRRRIPARDRRRSANDDARANVQMVVDRIADRAGGAVEVDIHATLAGGCKLLRAVRRLVVDGCVEAE